MGDPTQVAGVVSESTALGQTNGFIGWSPQSDRPRHTVLGGVLSRGAYATLTAYAVGDVVTYAGDAYTALTAVLASNTAVPVVGATWRLAADKRGTGQVTTPNTRLLHFFR